MEPWCHSWLIRKIQGSILREGVFQGYTARGSLYEINARYNCLGVREMLGDYADLQ